MQEFLQALPLLQTQQQSATSRTRAPTGAALPTDVPLRSLEVGSLEVVPRSRAAGPHRLLISAMPTRVNSIPAAVRAEIPSRPRTTAARAPNRGAVKAIGMTCWIGARRRAA